MGELVLLMLLGAIVIALGLWIFSNFAVVFGLAILIAIVVAAVGVLRWGQSIISDYMERGSKPETSDRSAASESIPPPRTVLDATREAIAVVQRSIQAESAIGGALSSEAKELLNQVESRKRFVKDNHIDALLCDLLSTMWHYPAWSKRDDADRWVKAPAIFLEPPADESNRFKHRISFEYEGHAFHLTLREWPNYAGDSGTWGDLTLTDADSNLLASINVSRADHGEYHHWNPGSVEAFKPGEWVPLLFALRGRIGIATRAEKKEAETGDAKLAELRANFDLNPGGITSG